MTLICDGSLSCINKDTFHSLLCKSVCYCASVTSHPLFKSPHSELYQCMHSLLSSLHCTAVGEPKNVTVTPGENSIFLEWSSPSEGSPLSYTVTWTGSGVTSSHVLPPTAHNYTIRGLDSNTAYLGTVQVSDNTTSATVPWNEYTLPQGELDFQSSSKAVNSRSDI